MDVAGEGLGGAGAGLWAERRLRDVDICLLPFSKGDQTAVVALCPTPRPSPRWGLTHLNWRAYLKTGLGWRVWLCRAQW